MSGCAKIQPNAKNNMAVSSGIRSKYQSMTESHQFFPVGDIFLYTPAACKDISVLVEVVEKPEFVCNRECCEKLCKIGEWCGNVDNFVMGYNYIPSCQPYLRLDKKQVYFKEI